eukprot:TRINITY_DN1436_c0_g1_i1.p1 TRINITY_DN1436_c0_g1~~TRINITY_DN1436_c0_g1_i1.p1  ORF type:complete len:834 (-),score=161.98 TRINITY_DN1436_c0_g1_i1:95-2596(-)
MTNKCSAFIHTRWLLFLMGAAISLPSTVDGAKAASHTFVLAYHLLPQLGWGYFACRRRLSRSALQVHRCTKSLLSCFKSAFWLWRRGGQKIRRRGGQKIRRQSARPHSTQMLGRLAFAMVLCAQVGNAADADAHEAFTNKIDGSKGGLAADDSRPYWPLSLFEQPLTWIQEDLRNMRETLEQAWEQCHHELLHPYQVQDVLPSWWPWLLAALALPILLMIIRAILRYRQSAVASETYSPLDQQREEEVEEGLMSQETRRKATIALGAAFQFIDLVLDLSMASNYFQDGLRVFAVTTLLIPCFAGLLAFMYQRMSWKLAGFSGKGQIIDGQFFLEGKNDNGELRPGIRECIQHTLQLEPFLAAWAAFKNSDHEERWHHAKAFAGVAEGFPAALLQTYAFLCMEQAGILQNQSWTSVLLQFASIATSLNSIAEACDIMCLRMIPDEEIKPKKWLRLWRIMDVASKVWCLAVFGISMRPSSAGNLKDNRQWQMGALVAAEIAILAISLWRNLLVRKPAEWQFVALVNASLASPLLTLPLGDAGWRQQESWRRSCLCLRQAEVVLAVVSVWCRCHQNPEQPHRWLVRYAVVAMIAHAGMQSLHIADVCSLALTGRPLLPCLHSNDYQPTHYAAAFGYTHLFQKTAAYQPDLEAATCKSLQPAHVAAACGHEEVVKLLHELAPATLSATDIGGQVPAHGAASYGQKEVVQLLHELAPATLSATDKGGMVPAHLAASYGQKEVVQLLHELAPATLSATDEEGQVPAHLAAGEGHKEVVQLLHELAPATLSATDIGGQVPAHGAAGEGHKEVVQLLRELAPATLSATDEEGKVPEDYLAE